jgi:putative FmdB family regulatory protein
MPTYEYHCTACGHEFEAFQSIKADPIRKCPACAKLKVERKIGIGGAVIFKGGGFYETDYRSESYTKAAEAERKAADGGSDKKGESGTAASSGPDAKSSPPKEGQKEGQREGQREASKEAPRDATKSDGKAEHKSSNPKDAPASSSASSGASNKEPPSKATHPSRVGRGVGNVLQRPPQPSAPNRAGSKPRKKR